jgi:hypothetical protein
VALSKTATSIVIPERSGVVVIFGEQHLRRLLSSYLQYYNEVRPHLSLAKDAPIPRRDCLDHAVAIANYIPWRLAPAAGFVN